VGRSSDPPMSGLLKIRLHCSQMIEHEPDSSTKKPSNGDKAKCACDICGVRNLRYHAFYDSDITVEGPAETATSHMYVAD